MTFSLVAEVATTRGVVAATIASMVAVAMTSSSATVPGIGSVVEAATTESGVDTVGVTTADQVPAMTISWVAPAVMAMALLAAETTQNYHMMF